MVSIVGITLLLLLAVFVGFQWFIARQAKRFQGRAAPELDPELADKLIEHGKVLLYFFSPNCGPCRPMTPRIERMATRHGNVFKIDVSQSTTLARKLGVMATPATVLIDAGQIKSIKLGVLSDTTLESMLA